jgi:1-aminocyclopropane-1-carboxylate deaminase
MTSTSFFSKNFSSPNQFIGKFNGVELVVKREDLIHPIVSGNKFRKLKYNLLKAQNEGFTKILTFGGAYSNHIAATSEACHILGLESIGIIRGQELGEDLQKTLASNPTLNFAYQKNMELVFVTRKDYRLKEHIPYLEDLFKSDPSLYSIPEGGSNTLAIKGCTEILTAEDDNFDIICSSAGTGGTVAGLIEASKPHQHVLGFSALKGDFLQNEISRWTSKSNWSLQTDFHFGGYAKVNSELIDFINSFQSKYQIQLDPIYTGKMFYGIFELIDSGFFSKNTRILAVHTGGLQGIEGMNRSLKQKGLQTITLL